MYKKILLTILCILICCPVYAMAYRPNDLSFEEVTIWIVIPYDDDLWILNMSVEGQGVNGLKIHMEGQEKGLLVEQTIAATATPTDIFAKRIAGIIDASLMIYLDFEYDLREFEVLNKITRMEENYD